MLEHSTIKFKTKEMPTFWKRFESTNQILSELLKRKRAESWPVLLQSAAKNVYDFIDKEKAAHEYKRFYIFIGGFDDIDKWVSNQWQDPMLRAGCNTYVTFYCFRFNLPRELLIELKSIEKGVKANSSNREEEYILYRNVNRKVLKVPWDTLYKGSDSDVKSVM